MKLDRRRALTLAAAAPFAAPAVVRAQSTSAPITIRVGAQPAEFDADIIYANEQGFFARNGITLDLQMMANGAATSAAILGGSLDVGLTDPLTVAEGHLRGVDFVFIAPGCAFATPWPLGFITRADANIREAKDFNGRTIGINALKNAPAVMAFYWIDHNGGDSQSVKWVEVPFPTAVAAIEARRIDGELTGEPFISQGRDVGLRVTLLEHNTSAPTWMVNGWMTTRAWAQKNHDAARRFAAAMREANRWANGHAAETYPIVATFTKLPEATIAKMIPHPWVETWQPQLVQPVLDTCAHYGVLSKTFPANEIFYAVH